jgi:hypothetical protein
MVANGTAEQLANEGTAALNKAAPNGLVPFTTWKRKKEVGQPTGPMPQGWPSLYRKKYAGSTLPPSWTKTPVNTPNFFAAIKSDALHKKWGIIWSKASIKGGHWIILPINKKEHLAHIKTKQDIGGKFVVVSWIAESIHKTINYEGIICPLTPLIITPLFLDTNPKQAAALITDRGDRPA